MKIRDYLPSRADIFTVYSAIVFWSYTWALYLFLYNLSSWMLTVSLWEIIGYFSYAMAAVFLDALLSLFILVGAAFILPSSWLKNDFAASGAALAGLLFFWVTLIQLAFGTIAKLPGAQLIEIFIVILASLVVDVLVVRRISLLRKITLWFSSSAGVFVYLYCFLSALGFVVILIRNLF